MQDEKPKHFIYELAGGQMETNFKIFVAVVGDKVWGLKPMYPKYIGEGENASKMLIFEAIEELGSETKEIILKEIKEERFQGKGIVLETER